MRALWFSKFENNGNTEAVLTWAKGVLKKGVQVHFVLNAVPATLVHLYRQYAQQLGLECSFNIKSQQVQNMLYYQGHDLLHVYHPDLFALTQSLCRSLKIPWLASCFAGIKQDHLASLAKASFITCFDSRSFQTLKAFFHPYRKENLLLIPPGVTIEPLSLSPRQSLDLLYIGPLESNHLGSFSLLNEIVKGLKPCTFAVLSRREPSGLNGKYYPWTPDLSSIAQKYNSVVGFGFFLLQGIAAGKIALLMEEKYGGIFSPHSSAQVPDFREKEQPQSADSHKLLKRDLESLLEQLPAIKKFQYENWNYARENHDLRIIAEKIVRLYSRF